MLPVLIIGGGLGGLTLAHALDKHHIPFRLFERDGEKSHRAQGYRISIDAGGASGLKSALRPELFATYEQSCGEAHHPGGRIDGPSGKLVQAGLRGLLGAIGWRALWALGTRYVGRQWERSTWDSWSAWARAWGK